ncbi:MAG: hypothetical protein OWT28_02990 [Firmicutes bacterium]|nr:hypothetical protein [Bacillota bacterium]
MSEVTRMSEIGRGRTTDESSDLRSFYQEFKKRTADQKSFEETYIRQTYLIRRDLAKRFNLLSTKLPGFKTRFINLILEQALDEIEGGGKDSRTAEMQHSPARGRELSKEELLQLVEMVLEGSGCEPDLKENVIKFVLQAALLDDAKQTSFWDGSCYRSPVQNQGRGKKKFETVEECARSLAQHGIRVAKRATRSSKGEILDTGEQRDETDITGQL